MTLSQTFSQTFSPAISRRRFIAISAAAVALPAVTLPGAAFANQDIVRWKGIALGASALLTIVGLPKAEANALVSKVQAEIERLEKIFSLYRQDSVLVTLNNLGKVEGAPFELVQLLGQASAIYSATNGAFDPTIQPLWKTYAEAKGFPDRQAIEQAKKRIGWHQVSVTPDVVSFKRAKMAMTLNGIAQGYITDKIADLLKNNGLKNVLVSIGEIAAVGERQPGQPWKVGLSEKGDGAAAEILQLSDKAVATSAPLGTVLDAGGTVGHIIDPRSGAVPLIWKRISVLDKSAAIADGLSTAFALMSRAEIKAAIKQFRQASIIALDIDGRRFAFG